MNSKYEEIREIVTNKLITRAETRSYEELSPILFNENFNESEVRKRMYGMKRIIDVIENDEFDDGSTSILSLSDFHIPFQLPVKTFAKYHNKVDILQLNGDILDMQSISKFPKSYRVPIIEEFVVTRTYLIDLIEMISPKKVIITFGNHEIRFENYIAKNIDCDLGELLPKTPLDLIIDSGFTHYDKRAKTETKYAPLKQVFEGRVEIIYTKDWYVQIGDVIFAHPLAYRSAPLATSDRAVKWFRNKGFVFKGLVMGHTHKIGSYVDGDTVMYEQGCCCDVEKCLYTDGKLVNVSQEGYIYLVLDANNHIVKEKTRQEFVS